MSPAAPYIGQTVQFRDKSDQPVKAGMVTDIIGNTAVVSSLSRHPTPGPQHPFYECGYQASDTQQPYSCWDAAAAQENQPVEPASAPAAPESPGRPQVSDVAADDNAGNTGGNTDG